MIFDISFTSPFLQIGGLLVVATLIGIICHKIKQPLFFAYLITGILVGWFLGSEVAASDTFHLSAELGIAFLLFLIGMEFHIQDIRHIGRVGLIAGLGQILIVGTVSFGVATWFGLAPLPALYVALAMTFASMIISVKYLNDHQATETLYGKVDLMLHLVQAVVAILVVMTMTSVAAIDWQIGGDVVVWLIDVALLLTHGALLVVLNIFLSQTVLPKLFRSMAGSSELLVLGAIAWCVFGSGIAYALGYSVEVGAFLAGLTLSASGYQHQITSKIKPIRDFFVVVFFISLGVQVTEHSVWGILGPAVALSGVVLVLNPLVSMILLGRLGYKRHTAFFASILMNQIGEFSLILAALGLSLGHLTGEEGALITATVLMTMLVSSFVIRQEQVVYKWMRPMLAWIERPDGKELRVRKKTYRDQVVVLGVHRLGADLLENLRLGKTRMVAVDYDPQRVAVLEEAGYEVIYGDAADETVLSEACVESAKMIISTIDEADSTYRLLRQLRALGVTAPIVVTAMDVDEALDYYRLGAAYVIIPMLIGGRAITGVVKEHLDGGLEVERLLHLQVLAAEGGLVR